MTRARRLELTADDLRAYSRRGNFHSEPGAAAELGFTGLVAQGMQVAGPAYGLLLEEWGEELLGRGEVELKFLGMVTDGQTVEAIVDAADRDPSVRTFRVENVTAGSTAVVGTARLLAPGSET